MFLMFLYHLGLLLNGVAIGVFWGDLTCGRGPSPVQNICIPLNGFALAVLLFFPPTIGKLDLGLEDEDLEQRRMEQDERIRAA